MTDKERPVEERNELLDDLVNAASEVADTSESKQQLTVEQNAEAPIAQANAPAKVQAAGHENQPIVISDDERQQLRELLRTHQSRLRVLEIQQAQQGIQTPAHIITEIEHIRRQINRITAEVMISTPARSRGQQRKLRADAFKAFHRRDWTMAEDLLAQALTVDPDDNEVRGRLKTVQQWLNAEVMYQAIHELRDEGLWQAVQDALDDLMRERPEATDPDGLRAWAEGRRQWEEAYRQARHARAKGDWQFVQGLLGALTDQQREDDPEQLWTWADRQQRLSDKYREARFARKQGDWQEVLKLLNERVADDSGAPDPERLGAWAEQERERIALYNGAITALETLLIKFPNETPAQEALEQIKVALATPASKATEQDRGQLDVEKSFTGNATIEDLLSTFGSSKPFRKRRQDDKDEEAKGDRPHRQRDAIRRTLQQMSDDE